MTPAAILSKRIFLANVSVHFVHAGNERTAVAVNQYLTVSGRAIGLLDAGDSIAVDDDIFESGKVEGLGSNTRTLRMRTGAVYL